MLLEITIPGTYSQKRHRQGKWGNYDPSADDKDEIRKKLLPIKPSKLLTGCLELTLVSFVQTPTSWSKKKQDEVEGEYRPKTPDLDNHEKIFMDAMNGYIYEDDKQIVRLVSEKRYSRQPATYIKIKEL